MKPTLSIYGIKDRSNYEFPGFVHDHNICLMQNGKVLQYAQLERITRKKYDNTLENYLEECLESNLLCLPDEFDVVFVNSFEANAFVSKNGKIKFESAKLFPNPPEMVPNCFCRFNLGKFKNYEPNAYMLSHELAHIFSNLPFQGLFKENSLLVHFDGGASVGNFSAFTFKNNKLEVVEAHWDMAHLSKFFNDNALNFAILGAKPGEHTSVPGKLMGFASFGTFSHEIETWLVRNEYFKDIWNDYERFFVSAKSQFGIELSEFDTKNPFFQDIAATFQKIFENQTFAKISELQKSTQTDYLYYSGGSALNIVTNSKIVESGIFNDVFIPPACNDSGLSLGAAAFLEWKKGNKIQKHSLYLNNIACDLPEKSDFDPNLIEQVATLLLENKIVAVANGFSEAGPRALGNRSILALANNAELAKKVSMDCKQREWYRPIAPIMLKSVAHKVTKQNYHHLAKYMLLDFEILPEFQDKLQGVIHVNGTARIQAVEVREDNPFMFDLLTYLWEKHHTFALINTSFNGKSEPIVHTAQQALESAKRMKLDAVIIDNKLKML